jgi:DNA invertase Pin-like site-specific DNA recombinase
MIVLFAEVFVLSRRIILPKERPMHTSNLIPAAQYLRMSTDLQEYSITNQQEAIREYAAQHGYEIIKTYSDPGKSGLTIKHRPGLRRLLEDVVGSKISFRAILVYDVSRWGRFQNADEAAHYEFICQHAGVPVVYCAEPFSNDLEVPHLVLKALKRLMAGEFSRELSNKTYEAKKRMVLRGYSVGGRAGFGLRRMLVCKDSSRNRVLRPGEYKSVLDRVLFVRGPIREVMTVQEIFRMYIDSHGKHGPSFICRDLNRRKVPYREGKKWNRSAVLRILNDPKYTGLNVWGRTAQKLRRGTTVQLQNSAWITSANPKCSIVDKDVFDRAGRIRARLDAKPSDKELLNQLRRIYERYGDLTTDLIESKRGLYCSRYYYKRFGSLQKVCSLIGFTPPTRRYKGEPRKRTGKCLRNLVAQRLTDLFPDVVSSGKLGHQRPVLNCGDLRVVVIYCPFVKAKKVVRWWKTMSIPTQPYDFALLCLLDPTGMRVEQLRISCRLDPTLCCLTFRSNGRLFSESKRVRQLEEFLSALDAFSRTKSTGDQFAISDRFVSRETSADRSRVSHPAAAESNAVRTSLRKNSNLRSRR